MKRTPSKGAIVQLPDLMPETASPIVQIRDLFKVYRQGDIDVTALNGVSMDIAHGEFVVLMGPSGSGKSTLLHILAGIDTASRGTVEVQGVNVAGLNESELADWRNQNVGFVFQSFNLIPVLTAFENVELPLLLTALSKSERRRQVETSLELVGLADRGHHRPDQMSGGQQQRVAIARAIATDPTLISPTNPPAISTPNPRPTCWESSSHWPGMPARPWSWSPTIPRRPAMAPEAFTSKRVSLWHEFGRLSRHAVPVGAPASGLGHYHSGVCPQERVA